MPANSGKATQADRNRGLGVVARRGLEVRNTTLTVGTDLARGEVVGFCDKARTDV